MKIRPFVAAIAALFALPMQGRAAAPQSIVAAENFYGDVAHQIAGAQATVTSILSNPDQDPHLFEASPSVARNISAARIAIYNGIDYDPWMAKLLGAARSDTRTTIVVADLIGKKPGDNPHIWYDPATMLAMAKALTDELGRADPGHATIYQANLAKFQTSLQPIQAKITALRTRLAGTPVTATEPVFGYMFNALGMEIRNQPFQLAVMNDTEPSASNIAAFETDLKTHQVQLLVYNSQASDRIAVRMMNLAKASHIPVVGATETAPPGKTYQTWMLSELDAIDHALPKP
ncbi:metal ABC transporter solute-binding protein, Zn/Mn family [Acidisphaera sp. L21]|uniref:metal ABC transporter solute-binding protein, Zn/Mn family n=1 Tax=Acidisphaera sp. L21 TaxID=1641851 RepID=UPI00131AC8CD|nr:zinc ABC transporter substrate-binding protein [Acidisphaera sp. L21]